MDRFDLVRANDLTEENLSKVTNSEFRHLPKFGPKLIEARRPDDTKARNELLFGSISGGDDLPQLPQYYVPYSQKNENVIKHVRPLARLKEFNSDKTPELDELIDKYVARKIDPGFLPLRGKVQDLGVIVDRNTGDVLEIVNFMPWR